ncbi:MAG: ArnT family glycosyltransferase [Planctomycetota bacterium]|jgi:4-amino-4-deoxy-L-arabinose transferase-like glycosyltransferase
MSEARKRTWLSPQVLLVFIAWLYLCWLHWDNDGLWYGDAPVHAANGLFWKDYLLNLSFDPRGYALSYFARYPVIAPTKYPPVFYLLEAVFFGIFGPSPYIAKGLVLGFTLIAALYTAAWCRRWIAKNAGWAGVLLLLLPGVIRWSHAIMLNVPVLALSIGALYHFRRWLESPPASPAWRHLYIGATLVVLSILTYVTSCVLLLIVGIWLIVERRWRLLWNRRTLVVFVASALALLPWIIVVVKFEQNRIVTFTGTATAAQFTKVFRWGVVYYLECLPEFFGKHLLFISAFGIAGGMLVRRWRHETILLLIMMVVCFTFFSYVPYKEGRYILLLSVPIVIFCLLGLLSTVHCFGKLARMRPEWSKATMLSSVAVLLIGQAWLASRVSVLSISGYKQLVGYMEKIAPDEPVFYDGKNFGIFTFYVLAGDPDYRRRVVLGKKLIYAESLYRRPQDFVSSPQNVVEVLRKRGGCQWVAVADRPDAPQIAAPWHLRKAINGPQFELVKSFPITRARTTGVKRTSVNVYRFLVPIEQVDEIDMPLFSLGEGVRYRIKPIQR